MNVVLSNMRTLNLLKGQGRMICHAKASVRHDPLTIADNSNAFHWDHKDGKQLGVTGSKLTGFLGLAKICLPKAN